MTYISAKHLVYHYLKEPVIINGQGWDRREIGGVDKMSHKVKS